MGAGSSLNNDYNRVLATQQRESINIPKFEVPNLSQRQSLHPPLIIPDIVRKSQAHNRNTNTVPISSNEQPFVVNQHSVPTQRSIQPISHFPINNHSQQQIIQRHSPFSFPSDQPIHHQMMNGNAYVIARSVINPRDHRQLTNSHFSTFRPHRSIVERNGKQFMTEFRQRTERRYVKYYDANTGQTRFFEVIDYIPSKIVRPIPLNYQSLLQHGIFQNPLLSNLQSNQPAALPPILRSRPELAAPSNPVNVNNLNNRENPTNEFTVQQSRGNSSSTNNTPRNISNRPYTDPTQQRLPLGPRLTTESVTDSIHPPSQHSQSKTSNTPYTSLQNVHNQYSSEPFLTEPPSFRAHTPTNSEYSGATSTNNPINSYDETDSEDDEGIDQTVTPTKMRTNNNQKNASISNNRNNTAVSYGAASEYNSSTPIDPFVRKNNTVEPIYRQRTTTNRYAEPITNNRASQQSTHDDYALMPMTSQRPNNNQHSRRKESNDSVYDG